MNRHLTRVATAAIVAMLLGTAVFAGIANARSDLSRLTAATARFHSIVQAKNAGYGLLPAPAPLHECISSFNGTGAMGFHYINGGLLDANLDPTSPEALVYEPDKHGKLDLVALEFVTFKDAWDAAHPGVWPSLFGEDFMFTPSPNRYDIPAFYSLHVWLWKPNPAGLFMPFNPNASCDGATAAGGSSTAALAAAAQLAAARGVKFDCEVRRQVA
jgi:hypothetical protein